MPELPERNLISQIRRNKQTAFAESIVPIFLIKLPVFLSGITAKFIIII